jgi:hypothetical protein
MEAMKILELMCALAFGLAPACGSDTATEPVRPSDVPESFFLATRPEAARPVGEVVASASEGDDVVVVGRVGGAKKVFVDGYAAFTIIDPKIEPCGADKMDTCPTPWDYCCDSPEVLAANGLSVELAEDGKTLKASPRGFHGLDHLKTVVVAGKIAKDAAGNVRVLASGLHVEP